VPASWHTGGPVVDPAPVTLVFVAWNARRHLARALDAAVATGWPVIVVDNASTDGTSEYVRVRVPEAQLISADRNLGFAGGVNAGVRESDTPWVLVLNPDIVLTRAAVERMLAAGASPDIGAVGAQLFGPDGHAQPAYSLRRFPTLATWAVDLLLVDKLWPDNPASRRYLAADLDRACDQDIEQPSAACLLVRREAFDAIGGFDTRFHPAWFEDVDFCQRLGAAGYRRRYAASAEVVHEGGVAMRALGLESFSTIWYRNLLRYVAKQGSLPARALIRPLLVIGMLLRTVASLLQGRPREARAYLDVLPIAFAKQP
jgi:N-acetylglucosaminyl-diphospho-decaprenol L-rhamnosyltransferase